MEPLIVTMQAVTMWAFLLLAAVTSAEEQFGSSGEANGELTSGALAPHVQLHKEVVMPLHLMRRAASDPTATRLKREYPRWFQAYNYKQPSYDSWQSGQRAERKRFLPFHPLARFRGLSLTRGSPAGGRGRTVGGGMDSLSGDVGERRWGANITPFSDALDPAVTA
ncbi:uncharacterized protein LOC108665641, partial [Hyalella azteca]|uniref:Uncharacterized protein LOC108665641 n=1 Tax=Hyalella azteca TaxID=294128 RepID=A0A8B7N233_HYAAZ